MAAPVVIDISFRRLLRSICAKFSLLQPQYGVGLDATGRFRAFVDVAVPRVGPMMEVITFWGTPSTHIGRTQEDAARVAVERLRDELAFEVKDNNYEERRFFENLYYQVAAEHDEVQDRYELLKSNYDDLQGQYNSLAEENTRFIAEWEDMKELIKKCYNMANSYHVVPTEEAFAAAEDTTTAGVVEHSTPTEEDPATPSGYRG